MGESQGRWPEITIIDSIARRLEKKASVCGRRAETVKRRRRDVRNAAGAQRRRRAADGTPPILRHITAARDERVLGEAERAWSGGYSADHKTRQRSEERAGHGD
jgi:hypothetical protein